MLEAKKTLKISNLTSITKPWEHKFNRLSLMAIIPFLSLILFFPFFMPLEYVPLLPLLLGIIMTLSGLLGGRIYYQYRSDMTSKSDSIGYLIIPIGCIIFGLFMFLLFLLWSRLLQDINLLEALGGLGVTLGSRNDFLHFISAVFYLMFALVVALGFIIAGVYLLRKNSQSGITRLFLLGFTSFGGAWVIYFIYNFIVPYEFIILFLAFYLLIFLGFVAMAHACRLLSVPNHPFFHKPVYIAIGISFIITILLLLIDVKHYSVTPLSTDAGFFYRMREYSILFTVFYLCSILIPIGLSIYHLKNFPDWITQERRKWIKQHYLGFLLLIPYPLAEGIIGLPYFTFLKNPINNFNSIPLSVFLLILSIYLLCLSASIILYSQPDIPKWFFEEIKFRASPELMKLDRNVNLAEIYSQIDEWQKESNLTHKEMTNQKLVEYVQAAKNLLRKEVVTPPTA